MEEIVMIETQTSGNQLSVTWRTPSLSSYTHTCTTAQTITRTTAYFSPVLSAAGVAWSSWTGKASNAMPSNWWHCAAGCIAWTPSNLSVSRVKTCHADQNCDNATCKLWQHDMQKLWQHWLTLTCEKDTNVQVQRNHFSLALICQGCGIQYFYTDARKVA